MVILAWQVIASVALKRDAPNTAGHWHLELLRPQTADNAACRACVLFDQLVGTREQRRRNGGNLAIDDEFEVVG